MNRIFIFCMVLSVVAVHSNGQVDNKNIKRTNLWLGAQTSVAVSELAETQSFGIGAHARLLHTIAPKTEIGGTINYTYLFPKNSSSSGEYGGTYNYGMENKGAHDLGISGTIRYNFGGPWYGSGDVGVCIGADGVESLFAFALEHVFANPSFISAVGLYLGICGDPKCQIGVRYVIQL